ncbi:MAG: [protein-PII] uridylyltransferase [Magnetococcales bacterium]|nr:[protein-PII] uridylyltransferase [Magnetococcales bacterium]
MSASPEILDDETGLPFSEEEREFPLLHSESSLSPDFAPLDNQLQQAVSQFGLQTSEGNIRGEVLSLLRTFLSNHRNCLHQAHLDGASGLTIVRSHTLLMDGLIGRIFQLVRKLYAPDPNTFPNCKNVFAVVATGGYGRRELAPYSDIDLLFVMPKGVLPVLGMQVERILYCLWDMGLEVGHAVRGIPECVDEAQLNIETRTALLESRFLDGNRDLFIEYMQTLRQVLLADPGRFLEGQLAEQKKRHDRFGNSLFYLEPNIKENPGGQRDIHTFIWISKVRYKVHRMLDLVPMGILTPEEYRTLTRCREFFWRVRNALHYRAGRREDRLTFHHQLEIAQEFGYRDRPGMLGVELFMRRYFQVAKQVSHLYEIFVQKFQEEYRKMDLPRSGVKLEDCFYMSGDKILVVDPDAFARDPVRLLRLFEVAQRYGKGVHPDTVRMVMQNLHLVNRKFRANPEAAALFLKMLNGKRAVAWVLRRMNTCGLLGRYIPEFGRIIGQTQHDLFHVYTVDEHSILAVEALRHIQLGYLTDELPLSSKVVSQVRKTLVLYLGVLFHDIAKGRGGQHEIKGAIIARHCCQRLGLAEKDIELVAWLVEKHLIFSRTAFRRDINDPQTISQFARQVEDLQRLDLLLLLTVADIRAVAPNTLTPWKSTLLRRLYLLTQEAMTRGLYEPREIALLGVERKEEVFRILSATNDPLAVRKHLDRFYPDYFISDEPDNLADHYRILFPLQREELTMVFLSTPAVETTSLFIYTQDHPGLFAKIAGAITSEGLNVLFCNAFTTRDGMAMDIFVVQELSEKAISNPQKLVRLEQKLEAVLSGAIRPERLPIQYDSKIAKRAWFEVPTTVEVDNTFSDNITVLEITTLDRPGLLFTITRVFLEMGIQIRTAKIATYGERAVDVFYLKDLFGLQLTERKTARITEGLKKAIEELARKQNQGQNPLPPPPPRTPPPIPAGEDPETLL